MLKLNGLFAALVTPYTLSGEVNYQMLKKYVRFLINNGISGFYVCGSTGEAFLLSNEERKKILETVVEEANNEAKIIAHIGSIGTRLSLDLAEHASKKDVTAISSVPPIYYKFSFNEIKEYYSVLASNSNVPLLIYNIPDLSGVNLTLDQYIELTEINNVFGIKFTSFNLYQLERIKNNNRNLSVLNGYDEVLLYGLIAGADGGIGSTYNAIPRMYVSLWDSYLKNDLKSAQEIQGKINAIITAMCRIGVNQSVKEMLKFQGIDCNGCRSPFHSITTEDSLTLKRISEEYNKFCEIL